MRNLTDLTRELKIKYYSKRAMLCAKNNNTQGVLYYIEKGQKLRDKRPSNFVADIERKMGLR